MLEKTVLPVLRERAGDAVTVSRHVLTVGVGESAVAHAIADIVDAQSNPTIAFLAGGGTARVRLTAKATDEAQAEALIRPVEAAIRERLGKDALEPGEDSVVGVSGLARSRSEPEGGCGGVTHRRASGRQSHRSRGSERFFPRFTGVLLDRSKA